MTVIIAVDRSENSEPILNEGKELADKFETDIQVVHVMTRSDFIDLERTSMSETDELVEMDEVRELATNMAKEKAEAVLSDFEATGLVGDPAERVLSLAEKRDARFIVVGKGKRSAVGKAIFGSTAQKILLNSECSVVVVPRAKAIE